MAFPSTEATPHDNVSDGERKDSHERIVHRWNDCYVFVRKFLWTSICFGHCNYLDEFSD